MIELLELNDTNRKQLLDLFALHFRSDLSIESFFDCSMGRMFVDDPLNPSSAQLVDNTTDDFGGFCRFAGDPGIQAAWEAVTNLATRTLIMPCSKEWIDWALQIHKDNLHQRERFSFSADSLDISHLESLSCPAAKGVEIRQIDTGLAQRIADDPRNRFHFANWRSPDEFVQRGIGICALVETEVVCAATSSLVCRSGIEVNVMTHPDYRRQGVATSVCARLALECLDRRLSPHWDAANPASAKLAQKLGYTPTGSYYGYLLER